MKKLVGFWLIWATPFCAMAQELEAYMMNNLAVVEHRIGSGETLESVSKLFNADKTVLSRLNKLDENTYLKEGQVLVVPVSQSLKSECAGSHCVKVYHKVAPKEGLFRIGQHYGNIKTPQLKQLNNLEQESVSIGQRILVGYLHLDHAGRSLARDAKKTDDQQNSKKTGPSENIYGSSSKPNAVQITKVASTSDPVAELPKTEIALQPSQKLAYSGKGFFENQFLGGNSNIDLEAGCFKSLSGWEDGKFYVLMNGVDAGRIIKLHNLQTNQFVFAKVLAPLPTIKKETNVGLRMSNATAAALGVSEEVVLTLRAQY